MKRNSILDKIRKARAKYVDLFVDHTFDLSERIQIILDKKGIDQKTLAKMLNKSEPEISKWMSGTHNYTLKTIAKIEEALEERLIQIVNDIPTKETKIVISYSRIFGYKREEEGIAYSSTETKYKSRGYANKGWVKVDLNKKYN